jgi:ectoine hydroxylase-related dioxygenase (phytanoyl-CoA dioxygenase family)
MVTLRVHLDPVPATNAPLLIAPGSHRLGLIPETYTPHVVRQCGTFACLADAGDIWIYATPILHASEAALKPARRRVLQVDYAIGELPGGLKWLGV